MPTPASPVEHSIESQQSSKLLAAGDIAQGETVPADQSDQRSVVGSGATDTAKTPQTGAIAVSSPHAIPMGPARREAARVEGQHPDVRSALTKSLPYVAPGQSPNPDKAGPQDLGSEGISTLSANTNTFKWGEVKSGSITQPRQKVLYTFQTTRANVVVEIEACSTTSRFQDPRVKVFRPDGNEEPGKNGRYTLSRPGRYVVQVQSVNRDKIGSYKIGFEPMNPASLDANKLRLGRLLKENITQSLQKNQYTVETTRANRTIVLTPVKNSSYGPLRYTVFDARGKEYTKGNITDETFLRLKPGKYVIQVQDADLHRTWNYNIRWL